MAQHGEKILQETLLKINYMYDVDYFIKKFEAIPENFWGMEKYCSDDGKRFCALGHCGPCSGAATELRDLFNIAHTSPTSVNDGGNDKYQQPTPKQRILAALYDIKKLQNKDWVDKTIESIQPISEPKAEVCDATKLTDEPMLAK